MLTPDYAEVLLVIRFLAFAIYLNQFRKEPGTRNGVITLGWLLYALSAVGRLLLPYAPERTSAAVTVLAGMAVALLIVGGSGYLEARALRWARHVLGVGAVLMMLVAAAPLELWIARLVLASQGVLAALLIGQYVRRREQAHALLGGSWVLLLCTLGSAPALVGLYLLGIVPPGPGALGTVVLNTGLLLFFLYAEHALTLQRAHGLLSRLAQAETIANIGYWERNLHTGASSWSPGHFRILGLQPSRDGPSFETYLQHVHPDDRELVEMENRFAMRGERVESLQYRVIRPNGTVRWIVADTAYDPTSQRLYGLIMDITALKQAQLELEHTLSEKTALLSEKTVLLAEVHHRVKNNLQVILSLLRLKLLASETEGARDVLTEIERRIHAMVSVHETLLISPDLSRIQMRPYLDELVGHAAASHASPDLAVAIQCDIEQLVVPVDYALPCGMIAVELVTNACRHAFATAESASHDWPAESRAPAHRANGRNPVVRVLFRGHDEGFELSVQDNGRGIARKHDPASSHEEGLGFHIIETFATQLGGSVTVTSARLNDAEAREEVTGHQDGTAPAGGTSVTVRFPFRARAANLARRASQVE